MSTNGGLPDSVHTLAKLQADLTSAANEAERLNAVELDEWDFAAAQSCNPQRDLSQAKRLMQAISTFCRYMQLQLNSDRQVTEESLDDLIDRLDKLGESIPSTSADSNPVLVIYHCCRHFSDAVLNLKLSLWPARNRSNAS